MNELIWIGNTLYPRWIIAAFGVAVCIAFVLLVAFPPKRKP